MKEIDQTNISKNSSGRYGGRIRLFVIHTQEGNGTARSLAGFLQNANSGVSYHYSIDNNECIAVVDTDRASWSVLDANGYTINLCFAGSRANMSRREWIDRFANAIDFTGWLIVRDAKQYGFNPRTIAHAEIRAGKAGTTDHFGITKGLGIGDHTDVGPYFPWDLLQAAIEKYLGAPPAPAPLPIVNLIDECRKANEWLGSAVDPAERTCPDGRGRFRYFDHGAIYWTPETGARAIPAELVDKFAGMGWETGALGYPVNDRTVLSGPDGKPWGVVQGFQGGNLYRRFDQPEAYWTHGLIGERWYRSGFENGPLGWPVADEVPFDKGMVQRFENGAVYWPGDGKGTLAFVAKDGLDLPLADVLAGYVPTDQERRATPTDGMRGGISHFAGTNDASTAGRTMAITGESADKPADPWFCAMRFAYTKMGPNPAKPEWIKPISGTSDLELKKYLPTRRLQITHVKSGKRIVVRPADWGPGVPKRVIDVSEQAIKALGAQTDDEVVVEWVDPSTPLGPR
ncbi:hypothetical protein GS489_07615 [Rhodococcus hoagii]|nr:hypothetical protein [Prescottella equi]MBM4617967.1 hypothetical protein [Prescottella equi]MBM4617980.1 hypothetical protein [Prescottella equi]